MKNIILALSASLFLMFSSCDNASTTEVKKEINQEENKRVKNIIFLIGDGMGLSQVSTTYFYGDKISVFEKLPKTGFIKTSSASHKITDSAAGVTAFSTGKKANNGTLGLDTSNTEVKNISEIISEALDLKVGIIATSAVTHATPAGYYAHIDSRQKQEIIAEQLLKSDIDFFAGGGKDFFFNRKDSTNLYQNIIEAGFVIDTTSISTISDFDINKKYGYILADNGMPKITEGRGDFLLTATNNALSYLQQSEEGFFLMIEGSQIDWGGHDNDAEYVIEETLDFEKAVEAALAFAEKDGNTLVVVTADHETGGFALASKDHDYDVLEPSFATDGHSSTLIPVFAYGPYADKFVGIYENTGIFDKFLEAFGIENH